MIARLLRVVLALLVGHALVFLLYWALINVPESNLLTLATSAIVVLALIVCAGIVQADAVLRLGTDRSWRRRGGRAVQALPAFLIAVVVWLLFAWIHRRTGLWHVEHRGEIDAWLIATFDLTRSAWLHRTIDLVREFLRDVIGVSLAVGVLVAGTLGSVSAVLRGRWIGRAFHWERLLIITVAMAGLIWLPWQVVDWRPASLPPTFVQPLFAAVKLGLIALLAHVGWALILWSATPTAVVVTVPRGETPLGS